MQMILLLTTSAMDHIGGNKTTIYWFYSKKMVAIEAKV